MALQLPERAERLVDRDGVRAAYDRMAAAINAHYGNESIVMLVVMNGGLFPAAHLAERLDLPVVMDYLHVTRYRSGTRGGMLEWIARPRHPLVDHHVLVVDDILDEGPTLAAILQYCVDAGAASVRSAVLVLKEHDRRLPSLKADFVGLTTTDRYLFGCGMDYHDHYRHVPEIWAVDP